MHRVTPRSRSLLLLPHTAVVDERGKFFNLLSRSG